VPQQAVMVLSTELSARDRYRPGPVEMLDQVGGGEVPDLVTGCDGGDAEADQSVGLAGARRSDQG